jgi:hypothetical protein
MKPTRITGILPVRNRVKISGPSGTPPNIARCWTIVCLVLLVFALQSPAAPFVITVIDDQTHRGVPLVELTTVNHLRFITDSAGVVAFDEGGFMNQRTFFYVTSQGYEFPKDGFGIRGTALDVKPGGEATINIKRLNIAQRLYRITGEGIYNDTLRAGRKPPLQEPILNGQVLGQDSAHAAIYKGKIHWFWGDTNRPSYPLGHFGTSGAVSKLPGEGGGLDPSVGIDLTYFTAESGFSRPMLERKGSNPRWVDGIVAVKDAAGNEHLVGRCDTVKGVGERIERELVMYNDEKNMLDTWTPLARDEPLSIQGHPFHHTIDGVDYLYCAEPLPMLRVKAELDSIKTPAAYEGFTCLPAGGRYQRGGNTQLERDASGQLVWAWKVNTPPLSGDQELALVKAGVMKPNEPWHRTKDVETNDDIRLHGGTVAWNAFKKKWILIAVQTFGKPSFLGEVWYSESDQPQGPFPLARRIVTHDRMSFYNPLGHPFFDQDGGRLIYFEGTYTTTFSRNGNDNPTPRYDYNQMMYQLDLADPRLELKPKNP